MKPNPVVWFEIYVNDLARAQSFYEAVFQTKLEPMSDPSDPNASAGPQMLAFASDMNGSGASGALVKQNGMGAGPGGSLVYFACDDCAVEAERAMANGGKSAQAKFSIGPHGFCALVTDTEGNLIGLHSMK